MDIGALREKIEGLDPKAHKSLRDALSVKYDRLNGGNREEKLKKDHTPNSFAAGFAASLEEINREYRPGTIDYVKTIYPELWKRIVSAEVKLNEAWLSGGGKEFNQALGEWRNLNRQAIEVFQSKADKEGHKLEA